MPQLLISRASSVQNSRALVRRTLQHGVINLVDRFPLLRLHQSSLYLRFHATTTSGPAASLAPPSLVKLLTPQPSLPPSSRQSSAIPQPDFFSDQKPPGSVTHRPGPLTLRFALQRQPPHHQM